jgi:hypothetical protein
MQRFGVTLSSTRGEFPGLYRARAIPVARAEGIRYVVFEKSFAPPAAGPLAYENSSYGVIDLEEYGPAKND